MKTFIQQQIRDGVMMLLVGIAGAAFGGTFLVDPFLTTLYGYDHGHWEFEIALFRATVSGVLIGAVLREFCRRRMRSLRTRWNDEGDE